MGEDTNSPAQIAFLTPTAPLEADGLSVTQRDFLFLLDAAIYFASGLLLYFQCFSNYKNSSMKSGLSHKWGKEREEMKMYYTILFGQKCISCFNFMHGTRFRYSTTLSVLTILLNLMVTFFSGMHDYLHFTLEQTESSNN